MIRAIIENTDITALGYIDQASFQVTDQIQNKANVAQFKLLQSALPNLPSDDFLWAHYMFDEGAGTVLVDISGNGYNGTEHGPSYVTTGIVNQSLLFTTGNYVSLPSAELPSAAITVSIWVRISDISQNHRFIWDNWTNAGDWILYSDMFGNIVWGIKDATNTARLVTTPIPNFNEWIHVVGTYDGTNQNLYVNGQLVGTPNAFGVSLTQGTNFRMGSGLGFDDMIGNLDECRIYTNAINLQNVKALYQFPAAVFSTGLIDIQPSQEVALFDSVQVVSVSGTTLTVYDRTLSGVSILTYDKYQAGDDFWLGVGIPTAEQVQIVSVAASSTPGQVVITLAADPVFTHYANEWTGKKIFGGFILTVDETNPKQLFNTVSTVQCVDYTKLFDAPLINDTWAAVDARFIINDFINGFVNYNVSIDELFADTWSHAGDGTAPTSPTTVPVGNSNIQFNWVHSGGTATFVDSGLAIINTSFFTLVNSGAPKGGNLTFWYNNSMGVSSMAIQYGSSSSNYITFTFVPDPTQTDWYFVSLEATEAAVTGTPNWVPTGSPYLAIIVTESATGSIQMADMRFTATGSFTMYNVASTEILAATPLIGSDEVAAVVAPFRKATQFLQDLADMCGYYWKIDYERDLHFFAIDTQVAPFALTDSSNNFDKLSLKVDTSQLKNRQTVQGGNYIAETTFSQTVGPGNNNVSSWGTSYPFANPQVWLDNDTTTKTATTGTTTTNVAITAHGLLVGQWVINRSVTGGPIVRQVLAVVNANNFTVAAVPSQASGNIFSYFAIQEAVGQIGVDVEGATPYMYDGANSVIRQSVGQAALPAANYLLFIYNPIFPVLVQVSDPQSVAAMQALLGGTGIFDGDLINDQNITQQQAEARAQGEVDTYGNPIVTITFTTNYEGLQAGQVISIQDTYRNINGEYLIQIVKTKYVEDLPYFSVTCSSTLFGLVELLQKIFAMSSNLQLNQGTTITPIISESPEIEVIEADYFPYGRTNWVENDTIEITEADTFFTTIGNTNAIWQPSSPVTGWGISLWQ